MNLKPKRTALIKAKICENHAKPPPWRSWCTYTQHQSRTRRIRKGIFWATVNRGTLFRPWFWWYCRLGGDEIRIQSWWRLAGWSLLSSCWRSLASGFRTSLSFWIPQWYWLQKRPTQRFRIKRKKQKTTTFLKHSHTDTVTPCCSVSFGSLIRVIESCKTYHT